MDAVTDKPINETEFKALRELRKPERRHKLPGSHWSADRKAKATRSRIANGQDILPGIDGRSSTARRYRDIAGAVIQDLGGMSECSATTVEVVRRFAAVGVLCEQLESRLVNGEEINSAEFALLCSTLVRLATKIGLRRVSKSVQSLTLQDYFDREQPAGDEPDA